VAHDLMYLMATSLSAEALAAEDDLLAGELLGTRTRPTLNLLLLLLVYA